MESLQEGAIRLSSVSLILPSLASRRSCVFMRKVTRLLQYVCRSSVDCLIVVGLDWNSGLTLALQITPQNIVDYSMTKCPMSWASLTTTPMELSLMARWMLESQRMPGNFQILSNLHPKVLVHLGPLLNIELYTTSVA